MRLCRFHCTFAFLAAVANTPCTAQSAATPTTLAPASRLNFDVTAFGLNVGYARRTSERSSAGFAVGVGGNWLNYMLLAGRQFSGADGFSYEPKNGAPSRNLFELLHGDVFVRRYYDHGRDIQVGLKGSGFLASNNDGNFGYFVGVNVTGMWLQWGHLQVGSEIDSGIYTEDRPEFAINIAPVLFRVNLP